MNKQKAQELKAQGNKAYENGNYEESIKWYGRAVDADPSDHVLYSNRSASYAALNQNQRALDDASKCVSIKPDWAKGYYRKATALAALGRYDDAAEVITKGLTHDSKNSDLIRKMEEVKLAQKSAPSKAKETTGLEAKAEGNQHFKDGKYDTAIACYARAIKTIDDSAEKSLILSNRAMCYLQLRNYDEVIADCNLSLELNSKNVKSFIRRALANEACEKYKKALADFTKAAELDASSSVASEGVIRVSKNMATFEKLNGRK